MRGWRPPHAAARPAGVGNPMPELRSALGLLPGRGCCTRRCRSHAGLADRPAVRPHRSLAHRATPATAYTARPKAVPGDRTADTHHRVRTDRLDANGCVTLRHGGRLYHIGIGRAHARTYVLLLVQD